MAFRRPDRATLVIAALFGIPPAIGMALATLRVTDGEAQVLAMGVALVVGVVVAGFVLLLAVGGEPDATHAQER